MGRDICVDHYSTYGAYHNNTVNKIIHVICVPLIVFSLFGMIHSKQVQSTFIATKYFGLEWHWGWLFCLHCIVPIACDVFGGVLTLLMEIGLLFASQETAHYFYYSSTAFKFFLFIHIAAWICQIVGHRYFEHRPPIFTDNLLQVFSAPFFVVMEVLFFFGYKPSLKNACEKESRRKAGRRVA